MLANERLGPQELRVHDLGWRHPVRFVGPVLVIP